MSELIGLAAIYLWVHTAVIVHKKVVGITPYELFVLIAGAVSLLLLIIGLSMNQ